MKNNTVFEYADNGIIIRYESSADLTEVIEAKSNQGDEYPPMFNDFMNAVAKSYGKLVANTIDCFDDDVKKEAIGFKVFLEIVPVFEEKHLFPKRKKQ